MTITKERLLNDLNLNVIVNKINVRRTIRLAFEVGEQYARDFKREEEQNDWIRRFSKKI